MNHHTRKALSHFLWSIGCMILGVFFGIFAWWFMAVVSLYCALILIWSGWRSLGRSRRARLEEEWWRRARAGVEQAPLVPCCTEYGETGRGHDESHCTRYRYRPPKPISREERMEIDRVWSEIIANLPDPEYGEEA
jgi:hypothetical protein